MKTPTDLDILWLIYTSYYDEFCQYDSDPSIRPAKIYVPIDCQKIAEKLGVNGDIVFGRLHYHLANKYKYQHEKNVTIKIFEFEVDKARHCIHFPYLASIVSDLRLQDKRFKRTLYASFAAVVISLASLVVSGYDKLEPNVRPANSNPEYNNSIQPTDAAPAD